jgi:hypothetical protein
MENSAVSAVTSAFQGLTSDVTSVMTTVAPYAIGILVIFLGFKYGKKILNYIAGR